MRRDQFADLSVFATVAEARSFTRAAVKLDMSSSALSHSVKALETRLGVRLLTRTTRSVAPTEAGKRLLEAIVPAFETVSAALDYLSETRAVPAGAVRLTVVKHAVRLVLRPVLQAFLERFPEVTVEITAEDDFTNIVSEGFDAGIRLGERVDKDMVSVKVSEEVPTAVVATPTYFERIPRPGSPHDLIEHDCIGHRKKAGGLHPWPFQDGGHPFQVKVKGRLIFSDSDLILDAALAGGGLAYLFADQVENYISDGRLIRVLERWTILHTGYFLYYASSRQQPPAVAALIEHLRNATVAVRV